MTGAETTANGVNVGAYWRNKRTQFPLALPHLYAGRNKPASKRVDYSEPGGVPWAGRRSRTLRLSLPIGYRKDEIIGGGVGNVRSCVTMESVTEILVSEETDRSRFCFRPSLLESE